MGYAHETLSDCLCLFRICVNYNLASCYIIKGGVSNKIDGNTTESGNGKAIKRMLHTMLSL